MSKPDDLLEIGSEIDCAKNREKIPKIGNPRKSYFEVFFPLYSLAGPNSELICFPVLGRSPKTYFLAGRLDCNCRQLIWGYLMQSLAQQICFFTVWSCLLLVGLCCLRKIGLVFFTYG